MILSSLKCRQEEEREYGNRVEMNKTAVETIKLFHDQTEMDDFLSSSQVVDLVYNDSQIRIFCVAGEVLGGARLRVQVSVSG